MPKRIFAAIVLMTGLFLLAGCGGKDYPQPDVKDVSRAVIEAVGFPEMSDVGNDRLAFFYDIPSDSVDSYSVQICGSAGFPDEVAIFKLKDKGELAAAKEAAQKRLDILRSAFADYRPDEVEKLDQSIVKSYGNYLCLVVSEDSAKAEQVLEDMFT